MRKEPNYDLSQCKPGDVIELTVGEIRYADGGEYGIVTLRSDPEIFLFDEGSRKNVSILTITNIRRREAVGPYTPDMGLVGCREMVENRYERGTPPEWAAAKSIEDIANRVDAQQAQIDALQKQIEGE